jgi:hypothetical protein
MMIKAQREQTYNASNEAPRPRKTATSSTHGNVRIRRFTSDERRFRLRYTKLAVAISGIVFSSAATAGTVTDRAQLADLSKAGTRNYFQYHNAQMESLEYDASGKPVLNVALHERLSAVGQRFTQWQNWSGYQAVGFTVRNRGSEVARINFRIEAGNDFNNAVQGFFYEIPPGATRRCVLQINTPDPAQWGMRALPPEFDGPMLRIFGGNRNFDLANVAHWRMTNAGNNPIRISLSDLELLKVSVNLHRVVDRYGQSTLTALETRVREDQELWQQAQMETEELRRHPGTGELQGSNHLTRFRPAPQWRIVRRPSGNYYFVHPTGRLFWSVGATTVSTDGATVVTGREHMFQELPGTRSRHYGSTAGKSTFNFLSSNLERKYGADYNTAFKQRTQARFASWGLNTMGINTLPMMLQDSTIPYTLVLMTDGFPHRLQTRFAFWRQLPEPFHPDFTAWMTQEFRNRLAAYNGNVSLLGVYVDNEHSWGVESSADPRWRYSLAYGAINASMSQPSKAAFIGRLKAKYGQIERLNAAWGTGYASWAQLEAANSFDRASLTPANAADFSEFTHQFASTYYQKVRDSLRASGFNGLYLGSREAWATPEIVQAATPHVDVLSFNIYGFARNVDWQKLDSLGKPVMISEFAFGAMDRGAFDSGPGKAYDQAERAQELRNFLRAALRTKNVVGVQWFQLYDQPVTGRWSDGENYNMGLIDITDRPYPQLIRVLREETAQMYKLRGD